MAAGHSLPLRPNESLEVEPSLTEVDSGFERGRMSISAYHGLSGSMICYFLCGETDKPRVIGIRKILLD